MIIVKTQEEKKRQFDKAEMLAVKMHALQDYDGFPYQKHLNDVKQVLLDHGYELNGIECVCAMLHDILEDCPVSYNDIKKQFGEEVAEVVYCVTDELGRDRKERKIKTYSKIRSNPKAIVIKLADRIANIKNSIEMQHSMLNRYIEEQEEFKKQLFEPLADAKTLSLWETLESIIFLTVL
jgi:(p)ppGpp synthase/HD superfamily hydrolase